MTEDERIKLGTERKLMFENVANGVPVEHICATFHRSALDVQREVFFVGRKIIEYLFDRTSNPMGKFVQTGTKNGKRLGYWDKPGTWSPFSLSTFDEIRQNRRRALETLAKLGPLYLSSELFLPKVNILKVDSKDAVMDISHRMRAS